MILDIFLKVRKVEQLLEIENRAWRSSVRREAWKSVRIKCGQKRALGVQVGS